MKRVLAHNLEYATLIVLSRFMRVLPRNLALGVGACLGRGIWVLGARRKLVLSNLRQALPERSEDERRGIAARSWMNFGRTIVEYLRLGGNDRKRVGEIVEIAGLEPLLKAQAQNRGSLILTGHLGSWAMYTPALSGSGVRVALLVGKQHNPKVDAFIHSIPSKDDVLIPKGRAAIRKIVAALEDARSIILVADQHAGPHGIMVPFLGRPASTLPLPGSLVSKYGISAFVLIGHRTKGNRHRVSIEPLEVDPATSQENLKQALVERYNAVLGEAVRRHPDQYFWPHRRWRDSEGKSGSGPAQPRS